ncbi:MAG: twin-arginine translocase TatA/TatE family subunit [Curtobacterium sp.]|nr:twin-arginine translocase TatA/TatE family subunit [Curtobacterium sp. 9128]SBN62192.1 sec-independent protein translocase protein TatA [Curtobacterium sp. 9128]
MLGNLTGVHLLIILGIVVLLFGATKLPALAKGLGQSINIFKKEMDTDDKKAKGTDGTTVQSVPADQASTAAPVVNPAPSVQPNSDSRTN